MHFDSANAELVEAVVELALAHAAIATAQLTAPPLIAARARRLVGLLLAISPVI